MENNIRITIKLLEFNTIIMKIYHTFPLFCPRQIFIVIISIVLHGAWKEESSIYIKNIMVMYTGS